MPRLLDSDCTFEVVLESDKGKTDPPTFVFRALSAREFSNLVEIYETTEGSDADAIDRICNAVRVGLVGWRSMGDHAFKSESLDDIVTLLEATELLKEMLTGQSLSGDDLKN